MKKNNKYRYPKTQREKIEGKRHYVFDKEKLPSVTTILDATQPAEKRESLLRWKERVGEEAAERIKTSAAERGTAMHKILEKYVLEQGYLDQTDVGKQAHNMAIQIIQSGLSSVTEYYGTECTLYYPGFNGIEAIVFVTSRRAYILLSAGTSASVCPTIANPICSTCSSISSMERSTRNPAMLSSLSKVPPV